MRMTLTPSMLRRKQEGRSLVSPPLKPAPAKLLPPREPPEDRDLAAASDWLAHVEAGRIPVR